MILALFICAMLAWRVAAAAPDGRLHVTFLAVGSADAVLIETPSGGHVLINGGPSASAASDALGRRLSPLDHRLDWLIVASTDESQVASLRSCCRAFHLPKSCWEGRSRLPIPSTALVEQVEAQGMALTLAESGQVLNLGDGGGTEGPGCLRARLHAAPGVGRVPPAAPDRCQP